MKLLSSDEITIEASLDAMKCSSVWAEYLSLYPQEDADDEEIIMPVALTSGILEKMLEWGEHYKDYYAIPPAQREEFEKVEFTTWDLNFLDVDMEKLCEIVTAADYLQVGKLFEMTCAIIAMDIAGRNAKYLRQKWGIEKDLTEEEEKLILIENALVV